MSDKTIEVGASEKSLFEMLLIYQIQIKEAVEGIKAVKAHCERFRKLKDRKVFVTGGSAYTVSLDEDYCPCDKVGDIQE